VTERFDGGEAQGDRIVVERVGFTLVVGTFVTVGVDEKSDVLYLVVGRFEFVSLSPEHRERSIEERKVFGTTNESGSSRPIDSVAGFDSGSAESFDEEQYRAERSG
jgi:hypothetical protein